MVKHDRFSCVSNIIVVVAIGTDDGDDLEMYGSEATTSTHQTSYSFEVSSHDHITVHCQPAHTQLHIISCTDYVVICEGRIFH